MKQKNKKDEIGKPDLTNTICRIINTRQTIFIPIMTCRLCFGHGNCMSYITFKQNFIY